jgi:hypothetical protein
MNNIGNGTITEQFVTRSFPSMALLCENVDSRSIEAGVCCLRGEVTVVEFWVKLC